MNLKFDEEPKYEAYMKLFEPLCGPAPSRPILMEGAAKVGLEDSITTTAQNVRELAVEAVLLQSLWALESLFNMQLGGAVSCHVQSANC